MTTATRRLALFCLSVIVLAAAVGAYFFAGDGRAARKESKAESAKAGKGPQAVLITAAVVQPRTLEISRGSRRHDRERDRPDGRRRSRRPRDARGRLHRQESRQGRAARRDRRRRLPHPGALRPGGNRPPVQPARAAGAGGRAQPQARQPGLHLAKRHRRRDRAAQRAAPAAHRGTGARRADRPQRDQVARGGADRRRNRNADRRGRRLRQARRPAVQAGRHAGAARSPAAAGSRVHAHQARPQGGAVAAGGARAPAGGAHRRDSPDARRQQPRAQRDRQDPRRRLAVPRRRHGQRAHRHQPARRRADGARAERGAASRRQGGVLDRERHRAPARGGDRHAPGWPAADHQGAERRRDRGGRRRRLPHRRRRGQRARPARRRQGHRGESEGREGRLGG